LEAQEQILVIPRSVFDSVGAFQGICLAPAHYLEQFLIPENNLFMERRQAEGDPSFKQLIPYAILTFQGKIFHYLRSSSSGEKRLRTKGSIGIGGHINPEDTHFLNLDQKGYLKGVLRELHEELIVETHFENRVVALINDDSNEVGRVHLGIVHRIDLVSQSVRPREQDILEPSFLLPDELHQKREFLETWSQICLDNLSALGIESGRS